MIKRVIIAGAGHRSLCYAGYAQAAPDKMQIVGVAEPIKERRDFVAKAYNLPPERCFHDVDELVKKEKFADAVINGTMDALHVATTVKLLEAGYDVLLEKPFAINHAEVIELEEAVKRTGRIVMICHVLRYAPFYAEIKQRILNGDIGKIVNIQATEHVSYHHYVVGYVRGKWRNQEISGSSFLMAKSCHDLDLIVWLKSGIKPVRVSSFGAGDFFCRENAPKNSGTLCLVDCPIEKDCIYSVRQLCLNHPERWGAYIWPELDYNDELNTPEERERRLRDPNDRNSYCVWKCDNNLTDRQTVMVEFADHALATFNLIGNCTRPQRKLHIIGTKGEIQGVLDDNRFVVRHIDVSPNCEYREECFNLHHMGDTTGAMGGHGGGDLRLIKDFIDVINGEPPSISCTLLADSIAGHKLGFAADLSMETHQCIELSD